MNQAGGILGPGGPDLLLRIRGRAVGAMVCAGFGAYSLYWWTAAAIHGERKVWFYAIAAATAILVVWAIAQLAALLRAPRVTMDGRFRRLYRIKFGVILVIEGATISLGGPILVHFHRPDLYPQWVDAVVGIHFLPLGKLFKLPLYYATGSAIFSSALGSFLIPPSPFRNAICAGGTGLALWLTAVIILSKNLAGLPTTTAPGVSVRE
jgi:hypothetical protein